VCFNKVFLTGEVASSLFFAMCDFSVVMVSSPFSSLELCSLSKSGLQVVDISQVPSNHAIFSHETSFLNSPDKFPEPESRSECAQRWGVRPSVPTAWTEHRLQGLSSKGSFICLAIVRPSSTLCYFRELITWNCQKQPQISPQLPSHHKVRAAFSLSGIMVPQGQGSKYNETYLLSNH
jgi:hypothetical protein